MEVILHSRACLDCQTTHKGKSLSSHWLCKLQEKSLEMLLHSKNFMISRNCISPNLRDMKSLAFLITLDSASLSLIK